MPPNNDETDENDYSEYGAGSVFNRQIARIAVGGYDDFQDVRTATMSRIRDIVRKRNEGIPFDIVEAEIDTEDRDFESEYEDEALPGIIDEMLEEGRLDDDEHGYLQRMLETAEMAARAEARFKSVMEIVEGEPIYDRWLQHVNGVGPTLTAKLIRRIGYCGPVRIVEIGYDDGEEDVVVYDERRDGFDDAVQQMRAAVSTNRRDRNAGDDMTYRITGRPRVSMLYGYAGLAPGQERRKGEQTNYDPRLRTLVWNVADSMVKQGQRSEYRRRFYDPYKQKQLDRMEAVEDTDYEIVTVEDGDHPVPATFAIDHNVRRDFDAGHLDEDDVRLRGEMLFKGTPPKSKAHADERARRYLSKKFIKHYWYIARDLQGLETPDPWVVAHGSHEKAENSFESPEYAWKTVAGPQAAAGD